MALKGGNIHMLVVLPGGDMDDSIGGELYDIRHAFKVVWGWMERLNSTM